MEKTTSRTTQRGGQEKGMHNGQRRRRRTDLEHELAHGFKLFSGIVLSVKKRVIGHLPQLHHDVTQLSLCGERTQEESLPARQRLVSNSVQAGTHSRH